MKCNATRNGETHRQQRGKNENRRSTDYERRQTNRTLTFLSCDLLRAFILVYLNKMYKSLCDVSQCTKNFRLTKTSTLKTSTILNE